MIILNSIGGKIQQEQEEEHRSDFQTLIAKRDFHFGFFHIMSATNETGDACY
jgi:hypothetical protein